MYKLYLKKGEPNGHSSDNTKVGLHKRGDLDDATL